MSGLDSYTLFSEERPLATGSADAVAAAARDLVAKGQQVLIFNDGSGRQVELDPFKDPPGLALPSQPAGASAPERAGRGRPKLGVVAREVTLLPRHWDWLAQQPGGASAALRRLVDDARKANAGADEARQAQQAVYSVMSVLAGDLVGFEEAARALYAKDDHRFDDLIASWPPGIGGYVARLAVAERAARLP